ncbi:hypothetical protein QP569_07210 [Aerococcus urinae]|nr:hypothetical protein [Aerococcus urinae]MDK7716566.1 hypothetical protein [Aerococcus urinae]
MVVVPSAPFSTTGAKVLPSRPSLPSLPSLTKVSLMTLPVSGSLTVILVPGWLSGVFGSASSTRLVSTTGAFPSLPSLTVVVVLVPSGFLMVMVWVPLPLSLAVTSGDLPSLPSRTNLAETTSSSVNLPSPFLS